MSWSLWLLAGAGTAVAVWGLGIGLLVVAGRRSDAHALVRFIPDCLILAKRLAADDRVPRRRKLVLVALFAYLLLPFDLVPDFIPVAGQLDDVIVVVLTLRYLLRSAGPALVEEHWPGPPASLAAVFR